MDLVQTAPRLGASRRAVQPGKPELSGADKALRRLGRFLLKCPPRGAVFDAVKLAFAFAYVHRRIPRRGSGLFNDFMFFHRLDRSLSGVLRQFTSDKVYAKYFIDQVIGHRATPETYAVFHSLDQIRRADLPPVCALKPAHASGSPVFLESADQELTPEDFRRLEAALGRDMFLRKREPNYRNLEKRIICEELIGCQDEVTDYKLFCHGGRVGFIKVTTGGDVVQSENFYTPDWRPLDVCQNHYPPAPMQPRPACLAVMIGYAEKLARHFGFVRVDCYVKEGRVLIGELTHCHARGMATFRSLEEERLLYRLLMG